MSTGSSALSEGRVLLLASCSSNGNREENIAFSGGKVVCVWESFPEEVALN